MPFDYKDVNNAKTQDEVINLTLNWIEAYTYYLHVYIDSCEDSNPFDIEMDRYTRKLHVNSVKLCGVQNELIELLKTNNRSRFKTFMLINKTVSLITKSVFTIYATDLFEDN